MRYIFILLMVVQLSLVMAQNVEKIEAFPRFAKLNSGASLQFGVVAYNQDGTMYNPTGVRWFIMDNRNSNRMDEQNVFTAGNIPGFFLATAIFAGKRSTVVVQIVSNNTLPPPPMNMISIQNIQFTSGWNRRIQSLEVLVHPSSNAQFLKLRAINKNGNVAELAILPCFANRNVEFKNVRFDQFNTKEFEVVAIDQRQQEIAKETITYQQK